MRQAYQAPRPRTGEQVARRDLADYDRLLGIDAHTQPVEVSR